MDDEMTMREIIANQVSISEQEDAYAALEAKYNNVEEAVEQDLLRAQFDRVDEDFEGQDMLAAQLDGVEDIAESGSGFVEECEDFVEKLDRRAIKLRYNAYCESAKKYRNNRNAEIDLCRQCIAYNKSLKYKPVEGYYDGEYKQGELLDLSVFPNEVRNVDDDNWGEPIDFSIEEILDMPTEGEVQMNLTNTDCVGYAELCKY